MKKLTILSIAFVIMLGGCRPAIKLVEGDLTPLKGQRLAEVQFNYDNWKIGEMTEAQYVRERSADADDPDSWRESWENDKTRLFETRFIEVFNRYGDGHGLYIEKGVDNSEYIIIIEPYYLEPGFNVGIRSKPAQLKAKAIYVKRDNPDQPVAVVDIVNATGALAPFDRAQRIQMAFGQAGRLAGSYIGKYID